MTKKYRLVRRDSDGELVEIIDELKAQNAIEALLVIGHRNTATHGSRLPPKGGKSIVKELVLEVEKKRYEHVTVKEI